MKYCRFCGKELVDGQCSCADYQISIGNYVPQTGEGFLIRSFHLDTSSVSGFISSLRDMTGMSEPATNSGDPFERNIPIVPDCIQPEENEIVVKQYNIAKLRTRLKFMKAEGRLMVTNRRLLFRATGTSLTGNLIQQHQFDLDQVSGVELHKDYKFNGLNLLGSILTLGLSYFVLMAMFGNSGTGGAIALGLLLGLLGMAPTFLVYKHFGLKLFCASLSFGALAVASSASDGNFLIGLLQLISFAVLFVNLIIVCFVPNLVIKIKSNTGESAMTLGCIKPLGLRQIGDDYSGFQEVLPWEDTILAINELGTMIDDLKKHGDYAVERWSR